MSYFEAAVTIANGRVSARARHHRAIYDASRPGAKAHVCDYVGAVQHGVACVAWANAALKFQKTKAALLGTGKDGFQR